MQKVHDMLEEKSSAYAKWHKVPGHQFIQWLALFAIVFGTGWLIVDRSSQPEDQTYGLVGSAHNDQGEVTGLTGQLLVAVKRYMSLQSAGDETGAQEQLTNIESLASARNDRLLSLMQNNPKAAQVSMLPAGLLKTFPAEVQALLEQQTEINGTLLAGVADVSDTESYNVFWLKDGNGRYYNLHFADQEPKSKGGVEIKVKATQIENSLLVSNSAFGSGSGDMQVLGAATLISTKGEQRMLVVPVVFGTAPGGTGLYTVDQIRNAFFGNGLNNDGKSLDFYYRTNSYGQTWFTGDVSNYVTLDPSWAANEGTYAKICYHLPEFADAADAAAVAAGGYNLETYNRRVYSLPLVNCPWAGLGSIGYDTMSNGTQFSRAWIKGLSAIEHEIGHNLGNAHANRGSIEYGDPTDVMGQGGAHEYNSPHKSYMNWVTPQVVTSDGTFELSPLESSTGLRVLKIPRPATSEDFLYVSYRQNSGPFDYSWYPDLTVGAHLHIFTDTIATTNFVDATPGTASYFDSPLKDGASYSYSGVTITQLSHTTGPTGTVTVQVSFGSAPPPVCTKANPTVTLGPSTQSGSAGQQLSYTLVVKNNDTSLCTSSTFNLTSVLPTGFTGGVNSSLTLAPGASGSVTYVAISPTTAADGVYGLSGTAVTGTYTGTGNASYVVFTSTPTPPPPPPTPDTTAPTVSITSPLSGSKVGNNTTISVSATDNVGVTRVEIYIDGSLLATDTSAPYSYKWNSRKAAPGNHTIQARAYDAAGNNSVTSVTVTR